MSNTKRPTTARKVTRTTKAARDDELNSGLRITFDGVDYVIRQGDLTDRLERELRREYGGSWQAFRREFATDPGLDTIGTFIWLARRVAGEEIARDDVSVSTADVLDDDFEIDLVGKPEEGDSPEA